MSEKRIQISTSRVPNRGPLRGYHDDDEGTHRPSGPPTGKHALKWFREVKLERIEWLWYPYIPKGKLTILGGDPGQGKSFITMAIAAAITQGEPLPGQGSRSLEPANVLVIAGEDDPGDTIKPRLIGLNADLDRIAVYDGDLRFDEAGLRVLRSMMDETRASLFVIDPIVAYLGAKMDMNRSNEVRPILRGLADVARDYMAAGLIVRHLRKAATNGGKSKALYSGMGSIDFTAAVRSELQVEEGRDGTKYMNHVKANAGPLGRSITYAIEDDEFQWGYVVDAPKITLGTSLISRKFAGEEAAKAFIHDYLKDFPDGAPSNDVYLAAKAKGIGERALKAVKSSIVSVTKDGNHWVWKLKMEQSPFENETKSAVQ